MKFHRITKPLTALALCALLATAYNVYAAPDRNAPGAIAQISPAAGEDKADKGKTATPEATDTPAASTDEASPTADATNTETTTDTATDTASADDDVMPPMATTNSAPVTSDLSVPPNESYIVPTYKQLQSVNMDDIGTTQAYAPTAPQAEDDYVEPVGETHPTLNLTPDKSLIVRLDSPAASVIVGNEAHISVLIDTPTTLIVVPRMPGASYFTVLDNSRRIVMRRHVVVGPAGQYVRVRRSCANNAGNCEHTSVFYCPDGMCHPIRTLQTPGTPTAQSSAGVVSTPSTMVSESYDDAGADEAPVPTMNWPFIPVPVPMPLPGFGDENSIPEQAE